MSPGIPSDDAPRYALPTALQRASRGTGWRRQGLVSEKATVKLFRIGAMFLLVACQEPGHSPASAAVESPDDSPAPVDVGNVDVFNSCEAAARRLLSQQERCEIAALSARCTPADDCLVTCLSSPGAQQVAGGCEHVCFSGQHRQASKPSGWLACKASVSTPPD